MEISSITLPLDPNDFPELADRLPTPKEGWSFANTKDLTSSRLDTTTGVIRLIIKHRLVKGVTADAVYWLYRNLHKRVKYPPSDATAKDIPLFQLLHPVDHLSMKCTTCNGAKDRIEAGSSLDFIELQMTKCRVAPIPFWNCSDEATGKDKRVGFVKGDPKDDWYLKYLPTRVTNTILQLSLKGYKAFGSTEGYKISYVSHDFANATDAQGAHIGLNVTTTILQQDACPPTAHFDQLCSLGTVAASSMSRLWKQSAHAKLLQRPPADRIAAKQDAVLLQTYHKSKKLKLC
ncbi:hypothetical protein OEZ85_012423 [Tetradesmus obliquus]|uniref:Uncharacterized protein n=1 Tax=Tetradesmus obliquus TaxID=3088 RepID=A0ABY8TXC7_TETOB|nr:hypothetical protein OEZ85_012423 [Tetradesmus obliquus]